MKIFKISLNKTNNQNRIIDFYISHVIVANNCDDALKLVINDSDDVGEKSWFNSTIEILGKYTGTEISHFIVLSDFSYD